MTLSFRSCLETAGPRHHSGNRMIKGTNMHQDRTRQNAVFDFSRGSADTTASSVFQRAVLLLAAAAKRFSCFQCERRNIRALAPLSDRQLKDMGINRSEIASVVRHGDTDRTRVRNTHTADSLGAEI